MTISEAFAQYISTQLWLRGKAEKTKRNYRSSCNSFIKACGDVAVETITYETCIRWVTLMEYRGLQSSTVAHQLSHLRQVLKYLRRRGLLVMNYRDVELPTIIKRPPVWLELDEVTQLLGVIENLRDKAIVACLFSSGARISELLSLNRDSLRDGRAEIVGKGSKIGVLRFDEVALQYLDDYLASRKDKLKPLFVSGQYRRITVSRVQQVMHVYADMAGIDKNVTPHVMRHSFASDLRLNGADLYDIKEQLRHTSISTTQIYVHIGDKKRDKSYTEFHSRIPKK